MSETKTGLELLRVPFPAHQISKLPKPTKKQTDEVRANYKAGVRCLVCGAWHHPDVIHLDYVGHAALTDRLLDADPAWYWEPLAINNGLPVVDGQGGMWIKLTVCGVTRLGYGHAGDKSGGDAIKEIIGDALRNAAMRFGAALDLWHKGDLHIAEESEADNAGKVVAVKAPNVKAEAYEELDAEGKAWVDNLASEVTKLFNEGFEVKDLIKHIKAGLGDPTKDMTPDEVADYHRFKLAVWSRLDSPVRSAIDKVEKGISTGKTRKDDPARATA